MTGKSRVSPTDDDLRIALVNLSRRLDCVEERLGIPAKATPVVPIVPIESTAEAISQSMPGRGEDSLEFELGQNWFAVIGIVVLAIGFGFVLSLPFAGLPATVPPLGGYLLGALIIGLAKSMESGFEVIAKYLRGAGMLLLFFASLRLFYFGEPPAFATESLAGRGILIAVITLNLLLAWRRASPHLFVLALVMGYSAAVAIGSAAFVFGLTTVLVLLIAGVQLKTDWRVLAPVGMVLSMGTYVLWAIGNPAVGNEFSIQHSPPLAVGFILLWQAIFTLPVLLRRGGGKEDTYVQVTGVLVCGAGFLVFSLHNLLAFRDTFLVAHLAASVLLLVLAVLYWHRERSWFSTFIYAMTGYMALSLALIKAFGIPEVFVALSLQSLVVIATAIYFRSRFIIVANCLIFVGIIGGYMFWAEAEQGMSIGFGVVALVSARILNWKRERLALKTELMRNAYLVIAFFAFPYALYYLVPETYVAVAWVGLALFYYAMNAVIRNRKYRWMGHLTLLLTVLYVVVIGTGRLESGYRIISFLVLGTIMLVVSLVFTTARAHRHQKPDGKGLKS